MRRAVSDCAAGKERKSTKCTGWGPKMRLFLLAFGIIALLGEQPFSKAGSWARSPASEGVRRARSWAGEERETTNRPEWLDPSQTAWLRMRSCVPPGSSGAGHVPRMSTGEGQAHPAPNNSPPVRPQTCANPAPTGTEPEGKTFTLITQCIAHRPGHKPWSRGSWTTTAAVPAPRAQRAGADTAQTHR